MKNRELKVMATKQNLIVSVGKFGGLWLSENDVDKELSKLDTVSKQREALKCQIQFRQKILPPININKKLFLLSEKGKLKSIEALSLNLKILISEVNKSTAVVANEFNEVEV